MHEHELTHTYLQIKNGVADRETSGVHTRRIELLAGINYREGSGSDAWRRSHVRTHLFGSGPGNTVSRCGCTFGSCYLAAKKGVLCRVYYKYVLYFKKQRPFQKKMPPVPSLSRRMCASFAICESILGTAANWTPASRRVVSCGGRESNYMCMCACKRTRSIHQTLWCRNRPPLKNVGCGGAGVADGACVA
jgi:hypothetical protein